MEQFYDLGIDDLTRRRDNSIAISTCPAVFELWLRWRDSTTRVHLETLLESAWAESPLETVKTMFYVRCCRGGRGLHEQFYVAMEWLSREHPETFMRNLKYVPEYGYWKDYLNLWARVGELGRAGIVWIYTKQLLVDANSVIKGEPVSLAGKWAPSVKCHYDKHFGLATTLREQLGWSKKRYSYQLARMRESSNVAETLLCEQRYDSIKAISSLPSVCRRNNLPTFMRHAVEKYYAHFIDPHPFTPRNDHASPPMPSTSATSKAITNVDQLSLERLSLEDTVKLLHWIVMECYNRVDDSTGELNKLWNEASHKCVGGGFATGSERLRRTIPVIAFDANKLNDHSRAMALVVALLAMGLNGRRYLTADGTLNVIHKSVGIHGLVSEIRQDLEDRRNVISSPPYVGVKIEWGVIVDAVEAINASVKNTDDVTANITNVVVIASENILSSSNHCDDGESSSKQTTTLDTTNNGAVKTITVNSDATCDTLSPSSNNTLTNSTDTVNVPLPPPLSCLTLRRNDTTTVTMVHPINLTHWNFHTVKSQSVEFLEPVFVRNDSPTATITTATMLKDSFLCIHRVIGYNPVTVNHYATTTTCSSTTLDPLDFFAARVIYNTRYSPLKV